ncbi:hypothetical protein KIN20_007282 [Parelaphostrongylus tenuis]|uniref:Uncharacterized protein n=1 Tax=Parelaphostrongylus tenuis TaxID=148309 RepID=A0AAD5QLX0_PARTN|nr:hypothetical protein KIN20_007282 [Parelaphostrongylus tenuis]
MSSENLTKHRVLYTRLDYSWRVYSICHNFRFECSPKTTAQISICLTFIFEPRMSVATSRVYNTLCLVKYSLDIECKAFVVANSYCRDWSTHTGLAKDEKG